MRAAAPLAMLALALATAGCGSSAPVASTRTEPGATAPGTAQATTPASGGTTASTASTAVTTAASGPTGATPPTTTEATASPSGGAAVNAGAGAVPRCTADRLAASFLGQQGATGHGEIGIALRNTGAASCRTYGYPGIAFLDAGGAPLSTATTRTTTDLAGSVPLAAVLLAPGEEASFRLFVRHIGAAGACATAAAVQVIAPDDTGTLRAAIPQGAYECGTATVTPVQAGRAAFR